MGGEEGGGRRDDFEGIAWAFAVFCSCACPIPFYGECGQCAGAPNFPFHLLIFSLTAHLIDLYFAFTEKRSPNCVCIVLECSCSAFRIEGDACAE